MIQSMTGFAAVTREVDGGQLSLELRAVNHRYLEILFRLDDLFRPAEPALRELIAQHLNRGKVEVRLTFSPAAHANLQASIQPEVLDHLAALQAQILGQLPASRPLSVAEVLRWPGMTGADERQAVPDTATLVALVGEALGDLVASRRREGEKLSEVLLERAAQIETLVATVKPRLPGLLEQYQQRLGQKMQDLGAGTDPERLWQEVAVLAQRIDVDEELARLSTHLGELRRIIASGGVAGKRLDFLMQELNRESNTLGAKSIAPEITQTAMDLKVLIEQMREQVQNIE